MLAMRFGIYEEPLCWDLESGRLRGYSRRTASDVSSKDRSAMRFVGPTTASDVSTVGTNHDKVHFAKHIVYNTKKKIGIELGRFHLGCGERRAS